MGLISAITGLFRRGTSGFTDFERKVLEAVGNELPVDIRNRYYSRISNINLVQRLDGGREVNCYVMNHGKAILDESTRIRSSVGESELARVVVFGQPGTVNSGKIWLVDGNLFSLEFDEPTEHSDVNKIQDIQVKLAD